MSTIRVAGAQINPIVGAIDDNVAMIIEVMDWAESKGADILLLPELAVTGYPPEDLVLRESFVAANLAAVGRLAAHARSTVTVVGFVDRAEPALVGEDSVDRVLANAAAVLHMGSVAGSYHKVLLPNYGVFDEMRYFEQGRHPDLIWEMGGVPVGVSVCEDIWTLEGPPSMQADAGAALLVNINGSPYHVGKCSERAGLLQARARATGVPVVYLNMVGGQDELVFDGESMVFDATGELVYRSPQFEEDNFVLDLEVAARPSPAHAIAVSAGVGGRQPITAPAANPRLDDDGEIYQALVLGLKDYARKNGFREVVVGLSGGIDSALTCAIAVDAMGSNATWGITMPTRYSSTGSVEDSRALAERLGCRFDVLPIEEVFASYLASLGPIFEGTQDGVAEENLQARIRGAMLMALSNKFGGLVVATGNKSESAVGYATLYGDMAGGFSVLKDVFKTKVYDLARWRNRQSVVIPQSIIDKAPSAELRPDQLDSDSLPEYELLDEVLARYVERDESASGIIGSGFPEDVVRRVTSMVDRNEYKRRQAAPGVRITRKAFGKDRRLPITNGFRGGLSDSPPDG